MCGLAGFYYKDAERDFLLANGAAMADAIIHRGPDAAGVWLDENIPLVLAHRRLSIQDLSPLGGQPMLSQSKRFTIAYNGEIYNFKEIAQTLKSQGITLVGHSDTEVLLQAIELWGLTETLNELKGMFAFALWDSVKSTLTLARDRIGEKPLYFGIADQKFLFASELKSIFAVVPPKHLTLDSKALASFMRHGYISAPHSIFKEIKKLSPGHYLQVDLSDNCLPIEVDLKPVAYWSVAQSASAKKIYNTTNVSTAKNTLDKKINNIISEQSIADVPLGAFLSGGIDSSLVSAVLQSQSEEPIDTYTIGFHEKSFNEAEFAKEISNHIGSNHHEQYIADSDILGLIERLPAIYDEPFADASQLPTILVSQFAKQDLTVCLSGDGGDELFCGYNRYIQTEKVLSKASSLPLAFRRIIGSMVRSIAPSKWDSLYSVLTKIARRKGGAEFGNKLYKLVELTSTENMDAAYEFLMSYWRQPDLLLIAFEGEIIMPAPLSLEEDFLNGAMAWDQQWYLPGDNLTKTDRASMSASIELRAPLLDIELIDFAWQVDADIKYRDGKSKWLLREVLYEYVPKKLIERPKMGFSVPISQWINGALKAWVDELLDDQKLVAQGIFNAELVKKTLVEHRAERQDHGKKLWTLLMFQSWYRTYLA